MCVNAGRYGSLMERSGSETDGPTAVLAARLRELRERRGWSADRLAEEMASAGIPWKRAVVTKLETGRRQAVSVAEWIALAYVLDVPPLELLAPLGQDIEVEILPGLEVDPYELRNWLTGTGRLAARTTADTPSGMQFWNAAAEPIRLYEQFTEAAKVLNRADLDARTAEKIGDPQRVQATRTAYVDALQAWAEVLGRMRAAGMRPPAYVSKWAEDAAEFGFLAEDG